MEGNNRQRIQTYLQDVLTQQRVRLLMQKGREEATVTISRAAELFDLTENRLRDWEERELLNPLRPTGPKGRRLYTVKDLDKLALIRELLDAGYSPGEIPIDIDRIWQEIQAEHRPLAVEETQTLPINKRIESAREQLFWRYFVSQALRLSLLLISEELRGYPTAMGLILPLHSTETSAEISDISDLPRLGESLVGWLGRSRSSHTLLTTSPSFEYISDYRLLPLTVMTHDQLEEKPEDKTFILLDRRAMPLTLTKEIVTTIRSLLAPIYKNASESQASFGEGLRDALGPFINFEQTGNFPDRILNDLAEMVIQLGGYSKQNIARWSFCCILLPNYPTHILSLQQRSLTVCAQSKHSPYKIGATINVQGPILGPSMRAYQSGSIIYVPDTLSESSSLSSSRSSTTKHSAIALPLLGNEGIPIAVLYVAAEGNLSFHPSDLRVLRMVGKMISELLDGYRALHVAPGTLQNMLLHPEVTDPLFQEFLSENDFRQDLEAILSRIDTQTEYKPANVLSFIAIDIDNQSSLANKYGDRITRYLSRAVGRRILGQLHAIKENAESKLYHINADRFYILFHGLSYEQTKNRAELMLQILSGTYHIDPLRSPDGQPTLPENMVELQGVTVRLGVSSYLYQKLREILQRYAPQSAVTEARQLITRFLNEELEIGKREGGNRIITWDVQKRTFMHVKTSDNSTTIGQ